MATLTNEALKEVLKTKYIGFTHSELIELMNEELDKDPGDIDTDVVDLCLDALEGKFDYLKEGVGKALAEREAGD